MAKVSINTSRFTPFTFDEMVKPLLYYKQAYDEAEAAYTDLSTQTEAWKDTVNIDSSPESYYLYKGYSDELASAIEDLGSNGLTAGSRKKLLGLKRRYASDITPIVKASESMNAANELRVKAGPDAIFEVNGYHSLDDFLHGKTANNRYQSRDALTKKTATMVEAVMAEKLKDPDFIEKMGGQYWMLTQHTGGSYEDLKEAMKLGMLDDPIIQNEFSEIRQQVAKSIGIENYDSIGQQALMDTIDTALYAGLDKPVRSFQANQDHITPYQSMSLSLSAAESGMVRDSKGNWIYDPDKDPALRRATRVAEIKSQNKSSTSSGKGGSNRETVSSGPTFIDIKNPHKSSTVERGDISGTKLSLSSFDDNLNNETWDDITKKKTKTASKEGDKLSTLILRYTGESTLESAFDKYDIWIDDNGNFYTDTRSVKILGDSDDEHTNLDEEIGY